MTIGWSTYAQFPTIMRPNLHQPFIKNPSQVVQRRVLYGGYGRSLAPNRVMEGVWGGPWPMFETKMTQTWASRWAQVGIQLAQTSMPNSMSSHRLSKPNDRRNLMDASDENKDMLAPESI